MPSIQQEPLVERLPDIMLVLPLREGETLSEALLRARDDCTGAEPSQSILDIRIDQAAAMIETLAEALTRARSYVAYHVPQNGTGKAAELLAKIDAALHALKTGSESNAE